MPFDAQPPTTPAGLPDRVLVTTEPNTPPRALGSTPDPGPPVASPKATISGRMCPCRSAVSHGEGEGRPPGVSGLFRGRRRAWVLDPCRWCSRVVVAEGGCARDVVVGVPYPCRIDFRRRTASPRLLSAICWDIHCACKRFLGSPHRLVWLPTWTVAVSMSGSLTSSPRTATLPSMEIQSRGSPGSDLAY
jgi:hypothetical protein